MKKPLLTMTRIEWYFSWRDRFSRVLGILSYVHVFKKEIGVINSPICGFYSLRSYTSNLVKDYPSCVRSWKHKKRAKTDSNSSPEWPCWLENKLIGIWYPVVKFLKHFYMYLSIAHNVTYLLTGALLLVFLFTSNDGHMYDIV